MWFNRLHDITEFVEYKTSRYTSAYAVHVFTLKRESVTTYQVSELSLHCTIWLIQEVSQLCVYCHSVSFYRHGIICYRWITDSLYHCPLSLCISPALLIARQWSNTRVKTWIFDARSSNAVSRDCCRLWSLYARRKNKRRWSEMRRRRRICLDFSASATGTVTQYDLIWPARMLNDAFRPYLQHLSFRRIFAQTALNNRKLALTSGMLFSDYAMQHAADNFSFVVVRFPWNLQKSWVFSEFVDRDGEQWSTRRMRAV